MSELLGIRDLNVAFGTPKGDVRILDGVNLALFPGERLALVGESGCGKTMLCLSVMGLTPERARIEGGIFWKGRDLMGAGSESFKAVRGREIGMIFEQPATCLHPYFSVGHQIAEVLRVHAECSRRQAKARALDLIHQVGLTPPDKYFGHYPFQLSGGMQQRVMIASALATRPSLLIADEPTTGLDVTIQAQIVALLQDVLATLGTTLLLISHDLGLAADLCRRVAVMYAGEIVECGPIDEILDRARHPYTRALLAAVDGKTLKPLPGSVPEMSRLPEGCRFHPRCDRARGICRREHPPLEEGVRCHLWKSRS